MSARSFVAGLLAAGAVVVISCVAAQAAAPPDVCSSGLVTRVYAVADLVVPLDAVSNRPGPVQTIEGKLMHLIQGSIQPHTWCLAGGEGHIDYYPLGMSLVVTQTASVQEQVADLLAALRRMQDVEVTVEMRFLTVSTDLIEKLGLREPEGTTPGMALLDDTQVRLLLETAQSDNRTTVMQAPRMTMFNGQRAVVDLTEKQTFVVGVDFESTSGKQVPKPITRTVSTGLKVAILPTVSPDQRTVSLQLGIDMGRLDAARLMEVGPMAWTGKRSATGEPILHANVKEPRYSTLSLEKTLKLADGTTALLSAWTGQREVRNQVGPPVLSKIPYVNRIFRNVSYGKETEHTFVMVTPRLVVRQEEEEKPAEKQLEDGPTQQVKAATVTQARPEGKPSDPLVQETKEEILHVKKRGFELSFQVDNVGPSKVRSIDVWWTHDGKAWKRYPDDVRPASPIPITVQADGRYGFTLIARNGAGLSGNPPRSGDAPQVWVEVDTVAPVVKIEAVEPAQGTKPGQVQVRWSIEDRNPRPSVEIFRSDSPTGPWRSLGWFQDESCAANFSESDVPCGSYLRIEGHDTCGNVGVAISREPVRIDSMIPRIRDVRLHGGR